MATARSWARLAEPPGRRGWSSAVKASMIWGASTQNTTVMTTSTTADSVTTAEMARQASRSDRVASRSTKTGMKVADSTPPRTMS